MCALGATACGEKTRNLLSIDVWHSLFMKVVNILYIGSLSSHKSLGTEPSRNGRVV